MLISLFRKDKIQAWPGGGGGGVMGYQYTPYFSPEIPISGLQITNGQAPDTLSGQTSFCSDTIRLWPVKLKQS